MESPQILLKILIVCMLMHGLTAKNTCSITDWSSFKVEFHKTYDSVEEDNRRQHIFCQNMNLIEAHNRAYEMGSTTFTMGINQFTDWTENEFHAWLQGASH